MNEQPGRQKVSTQPKNTQRLSSGSNPTTDMPTARVDAGQLLSSEARGTGGDLIPRTPGPEQQTGRQSQARPQGETRGEVQTRERGGAVVAWGAAPLTRKQQEILTENPKDEELAILPTGELYVPHQHIRARLNSALGAGNWRMVELGEPAQNEKEVIWRWRLEFVNGWSASTVGHALYNKTNPRGTYGDALETCKSDALVRAVKDLGFGTVLLNREWKEGWRAQHCVLVYRLKEMKLAWRRRDVFPWEDEGQPDRESKGYFLRQMQLADEIGAHWEVLTEKRADAAVTERAAKEYRSLERIDPYDEMSELARLEAEDALFGDDLREDT